MTAAAVAMLRRQRHGWRAASRRRRQRFSLSAPATAGAEDVTAPRAGSLEAFWKFLRPHTIRGTILGSSAMAYRAMVESGFYPELWMMQRCALGVLALLAGNGFIVGINQIYDVSIDKLNKPFLPIAAQELSTSKAWVLTIVMAILGTTLAYSFFGSLIGGLYVFGLFLGTIYSVPPLRLKQVPWAAATIIAIVRGFLLNFGVYYATRAMLNVDFSWSFATAFMTCFVTVEALVIAITKDLPDVRGDVENNIPTFATRFGVAKVATAATIALLANYATAIFWTSVAPAGHFFRPRLFLTGHAILATLLVRGLRRLARANYSHDAIKAFYRLIWLLFYSEYALFPFI